MEPIEFAEGILAKKYVGPFSYSADLQSVFDGSGKLVARFPTPKAALDCIIDATAILKQRVRGY